MRKATFRAARRRRRVVAVVAMLACAGGTAVGCALVAPNALVALGLIVYLVPLAGLGANLIVDAVSGARRSPPPQRARLRRWPSTS